jgi:hypothetical protein
MARFALTACAALMLAAVPSASPGVRSSSIAAGVPSGLHAFLLRADEPIAHQYPRTPAFAWTSVAEHGGHYEFQLATSPHFQDGSLVFTDTNVLMPAVTVERQLPWMTGDPYALWAHVRWVSNDGTKATIWSKPFGFNMRWRDQDVPQQLAAPEGLIRWKPIQGATAYQVLYTDIRPADSFITTTNVADEREFFTFHSAFGYSTTIHWRVRAIRDVTSLAGPANGLPAVSYGPWSAPFSSTNAAQATGALKATDTVSDYWDKTGKGRPDNLTPAFAWTPTAPVITDGIDPGSPLYRVYIFTDSNCVNRVFTGSIVGSPAYAPRAQGGPIALPGTLSGMTKVSGNSIYPGPGSEGDAVDATGEPVKSNEVPGGSVSASSSSSPSDSSSSSSGSSSASLAQVDLWDSGWPTGRYYWTVVPVTVVAKVTLDDPPAGSAPSSPALEYQDTAVPQDACQSGAKWAFGKVSRPVVTSAGKPFVSGVRPNGRSVASVGAHTAVYETPIVAWQPAIGATDYQVELSRSRYPWHATTQLSTPATSITLPLTKLDAGTWFYRVRGVNQALPTAAQAMTWSSVVRIKITGDQFAIVK